MLEYNLNRVAGTEFSPLTDLKEAVTMIEFEDGKVFFLI